MSKGNIYKPRYSITNRSRSKIWMYKNGYLRRFYERRGRRVKRGGLFRQLILVANNRKWTIARRYMRPIKRRVRLIKKSTSSTINGRPAKRRYINSFNQKQRLRQFYGNRKENTFASLFNNCRTMQGTTSQSFFSLLESQIDRTLYRRRILPTIYACRQLINHHGILINNGLEKSAHAQIKVGDTIALPNIVWKQLYWDIFFRTYFRRWGLFLFSRRFYSRLKKKIYQKRYKNYYFKKPNRLATKWASFNSPFSISNIFDLFQNKNKRRKNRMQHIKSPVRRGFFIMNHLKGKKIKSNKSKYKYRRAFSRYLNHFSGYLNTFVPVKIFNSTKYFKNKNSNNSMFIAPFSKEQNKYVSFVFKRNKPSIKQSFFGNRNLFVKQLKTDKVFTENQLEKVLKERKPFKKLNIQMAKQKKLETLFYSQKIRKFFLPKYIKKGSIKKKKRKKIFFKLKRKRWRLTKFLRRWKFRYKKKRRHIRLKPVHRYIPQYLQPDFRTLRVTRINSPSSKQIYTGFRLSASKITSFYKSQGFLFDFY